jgi:hypothetical protein
MVRLAALTVASSLLVAGCGGGSDDNAKDDIRAAVDDYAQALSGKEPTRLCDVLVTRKLLKASKGDRDKELDACRTRMKKQDFSGAPAPQDVNVARVKVDGDKATARITTGSGAKRQTGTIPFRKVDGTWRILAGS